MLLLFLHSEAMQVLGMFAKYRFGNCFSQPTASIQCLSVKKTDINYIPQAILFAFPLTKLLRIHSIFSLSTKLVKLFYNTSTG